MKSSYITLINDFLKKKHVQILLDILRIISLVSLLVTFFGVFIFALGYTFLYGYFFSGKDPGFYSIFDIISNPIPFNYYSITIVSSFLIISVVFLISAFLIIKKRKFALIFGTILFFVVFHICLSIFFVKGTDLLEKVTLFMIIWAVPLFITIMIFWAIRAPLRTGSSLSGTLYGVFIIVLITWINSISEIYLQFLVPLCSFTLGILFTYIKPDWFNYKKVRVLIIFPYVLLIIGLLIALSEYLIDFKLVNNIKPWLLIGISLCVSILISFKKYNLKEQVKADDLVKTKFEIYIKQIEQVSKSTLVATLSIVLIVLGTLTPQLSVIGGQYIREFTTDGLREIQLIRDYNNKIIARGNIVSINNGIYYVSDMNWKLMVVKGDKIVTESVSEE